MPTAYPMRHLVAAMALSIAAQVHAAPVDLDLPAQPLALSLRQLVFVTLLPFTAGCDQLAEVLELPNPSKIGAEGRAAVLYESVLAGIAPHRGEGRQGRGDHGRDAVWHRP